MVQVHSLLLLCLAAHAYPTLKQETPAYAETIFPEGVFGVWTPSQAPQSMLGPLAYYFINPPATGQPGGFSAQRDPKTGDVWFAILQGQTFHVRENLMQYCFGYQAPGTGILPVGYVKERSPFSVNSTTNTSVQFCWREGFPGMQTHSKNCRGCDCAKIVINVNGNSLDLTFWQSPPVIHAHLVMSRSGPAPDMSVITTTLPDPYGLCPLPGVCDPWQFCPPGMVAAAPTSALPTTSPRHFGARGCLRGAMDQVQRLGLLPKVVEAEPKAEADNNTQCFQLNGYNVQVNNLSPAKLRYDLPDIKVQVTKPTTTCNPCDVSYAVSAELADDEYVALGFKGESWEGENTATGGHSIDARPCYFAMCVDSFDNFTSDRLAVAYATVNHGACMREMVSKNIVGTPTDVDFKLFSGTSVKRVGSRTVMTFTVSQHWPTAVANDGLFRVMYAKGAVSGGSDCSATLGFHGIARGVAPLEWLDINSRACTFQ